LNKSESAKVRVLWFVRIGILDDWFTKRDDAEKKKIA
jgi:hypothetical protein